MDVFSRSLANALAGAVVWFVLLPFSISDSSEGELIQRVLLLGVLVIVPLGLGLASSVADSNSRPFHLAVVLQPAGALAVIISALLEPGYPAAVLATLWLLLTGVIALGALERLYRLRFTQLPVTAHVSLIAGMVFLPVGAAWLIMSRLGIQAFGFGDTIVLLTAVHFHFAGYAAPLLTGLTGYHLPANGKSQTLLLFAVVGVIAGTPLVAAGITLSPFVALVGAVVISVGLFSLSLLNVIWILPRLSSIAAKTLLLISVLASLPAMALAIVYAYSIVFQKLIVDIPQMAMTHGVFNAFGFALCGLVAWVLVVRSES